MSSESPPDPTVSGENESERLPTAFYEALDEFNRGEYFACHETLEALWIPERRPIREVYQGVLQIAVGCYHLTARANWVGAVNKLDAGARRLERAGVLQASESLPVTEGSSLETQDDGLYGVDWNTFLAAADRLQAHLRTLGRDRIAFYDRLLLPTIRYTSTIR